MSSLNRYARMLALPNDADQRREVLVARHTYHATTGFDQLRATTREPMHDTSHNRRHYAGVATDLDRMTGYYVTASL